MRRFLLTILVVLFFALTACDGQPTPTAATGAEIDVANLPTLIDPQTANLLRERDDVLFLDVREQSEYDAGHIPGITLIPMGEIPNRLADIPKDKTVIVSCRSGRRSAQVASFLQEQGFTNIHDLDGGFSAWQQAGLPVEQ